MPDQKKKQANPAAVSEEKRNKEKNGKKNRRKKHFRLSIFLFCLTLFLTILLILWCCIWFWSMTGIPDSLVGSFRYFCRSYGIEFEAEDVRTVMPLGLSFRNVKFHSDGHGNVPEISAASLQIRFYPLSVVSGVMMPMQIRMKGGRASIPVFPERGKEGAEETIHIEEIDLDANGEKGVIRIKKFSGKIEQGRFLFSGTLDNMLHILIAESGMAVNRKMRENSTLEKNDQWYAKLLQKIPEAKRSAIIRLLNDVREKHFAGIPFLNVSFHMDLKDITKNKANAVLSVPEFAYGKLIINPFTEKISASRGLMKFHRTKIEFGNGESFVWEGSYNMKTNDFSGHAEGSSSLHKILLFADQEARKILLKIFDGDDRFPVTFTWNLKKYSPATGALDCGMILHLPDFNREGITIRKIQCSLTLKDNDVKGSIRNCLLTVPGSAEEGSLNAVFLLRGNTLTAKLEGKTPPVMLKRIFPESQRKIIDSFFRFDKKHFLKFQGRMSLNSEPRQNLSGTFQMSIPGVVCCGIPAEDLQAELEFDSDVLKITSMKTRLARTMDLSGSAVFLPSEGSSRIKFRCSGSPGKAIEQMDHVIGKELRQLTSEIVWPAKGSLMEADASILVNFSSREPQWFTEGNIVMSDFRFRNIPFRYGATRFLIDSDDRIILPGTVIETKDGKALINVSYNGSPNRKKITPKKKNTKETAGNVSKGILDFTLDSTISGNDMLKCLYPEWTSEFLDFPHSINVRAFGRIDYLDDGNTKYSANISNGACRWKKADLTDVDAVVEYKNENLSIRKAEASVCGGKLLLDYLFDFHDDKRKGKIDLQLKNADFAQFLKALDTEPALLKGIRAELAGSMSAEVAFDEKENILLYGKGDAAVTGSDMWHIPVLGELLVMLGKAWNTQSLGTISEVKIDYSVDKTTFRIDNGVSNGSVVAMKANGFYDWQTSDFDFTIQTELLKDTLPFAAMSKVLTPVSWIMQKRIHGNSKTSHWD